MLYLILSILFSTSIFVIFKLLDKYKIDIFNVIVINYFTATIFGFLLLKQSININQITQTSWFPLTILIGILFILMFYIVGISSQKAGIIITTISSKISVILPISFSILYDRNDSVSPVKLLGIALALVAVFTTIYKKKSFQIDIKTIYLPIFLFIGMGVVDSLLKFSQYKWIDNSVLPLFSAVVFMFAALTGLILSIFRWKKSVNYLNRKSIIFGILLGLTNFCSMFFLIKTLNYKNGAGSSIDSSIIFGINNLGIIILSLLTGLFFFYEKITTLNKFGIALSIITILVLSYS